MILTEPDGMMRQFAVCCRWPDGDTEWLFCDDAAQAASWAADARQDAVCVTGVYALQVQYAPGLAPVGRYAGTGVRSAARIQ